MRPIPIRNLIQSAAATAWLAWTLTGCGESGKTNKAQNLQAAPAAKPGQFILAADSPQLVQIRSEAVEVAMVPVGSVSAPGKVEANANRLSHVVVPVTGKRFLASKARTQKLR